MEIYEKESVSLYLSNMVQLENEESNVQSIQIYQHPNLGKVLVINGEIQNVEKWAPLYHEAIVHIPMMFLEEPRSVLILGGGDLYAAEIALQYPSVEQVTLCDYDPEIIRLTSKHYVHAQSVLNNPKVTICYQDAKEYIKECTKKFDLIVDDCFNLIKDFAPHDQIFKQLANLLTPGIGVCSSLMYRHIFDQFTIEQTNKNLLSQFNTVLSLVTVPEYPGILHLLTMWGHSIYLSQDLPTSKNRYHMDMLQFGNHQISEIFDPKFCKYYLYLPKYIKNILR
jgi:spermidine synthase